MCSINQDLSQEHELDVSRLTDELLAARLESGRLAAQEVLTPCSSLHHCRYISACIALENVWFISTVDFCAPIRLVPHTHIFGRISVLA